MDTFQTSGKRTLYRFRPYNALSLKELLYGEIFFSAKDEINDPYDTKNLSLFVANSKVYERLLNVVFSKVVPFLANKKIKVDSLLLAQFLSRRDLYYEELISLISSEEFEQLVVQSSHSSNLGERIMFSLLFIKQLIAYIQWHVHRHCYIVSFSKSSTNPLLWSHYANNHKGFCLCFSVEDTFKASNSNSKIPELKFEDVQYRNENVTKNGFYSFPGAIWGNDVSKEEVNRFWDLKKEAYLTKYQSWSYEQEVRLVFDDWFPSKVTSEGSQKMPIVNRLFYYDLKQFTGIIFGSELKNIEKEEIKNIVIEFRQKQLLKDDCYPVFLFYEAGQNTVGFEMKIKSVYGLDSGNSIFPMDKYDEKVKIYQRMQKHYADRKNR